MLAKMRDYGMLVIQACVIPSYPSEALSSAIWSSSLLFGQLGQTK